MCTEHVSSVLCTGHNFNPKTKTWSPCHCRVHNPDIVVATRDYEYVKHMRWARGNLGNSTSQKWDWKCASKDWDFFFFLMKVKTEIVCLPLGKKKKKATVGRHIRQTVILCWTGVVLEQARKPVFSVLHNVEENRIPGYLLRFWTGYSRWHFN